MDDAATVQWKENGGDRSARWRSERGAAPPARVVIGDDTMSAADAFRLASEGTAILWRGDFQNARQLLQALARRVDRKPPKPGATPAETFHRYRLAQSRRARTLGMLLLPFDANHAVPLRRAPDVRQACTEAYGAVDAPYVASLRDLLGVIGAHEWRKRGVQIPAAGGRIHPHYGVFAPVRSEYVKLIAETPLPSIELAFDIGTGTGVLAAVLARRGVARIVATDNDPRAVACARENIARLGLEQRIDIVEADLFPEGRAPLVVCNPPWIPARPNSPLDRAIYDPGESMLLGFLAGLSAHLAPGGEGWLILSDLAERLELRTERALRARFNAAGLDVLARSSVRPAHPRRSDRSDPLHAARAAEKTWIWRLTAARAPSA